MILDYLTLHNFGVYRGEHRVELSPTAGRPIVLLGALNGGGKTTFLDALQLVLYGRHARCVTRAKLGYSDYLKRSINRAVHAGAGAGIELGFRYREGGRDETLRIVRTWSEVGKDNIEVYRGDKHDPAASERWHEIVEQFMPNQISDLFFFDGEKIESLADTEHSADLLRVGIHALLGLDLVDDLARSLLQVERRRKAKLAGVKGEEKMRPLQLAIEALSGRRGELGAQMAAIQNQLDRVRETRVGLEARLKSEGGALFDKRAEIRDGVSQQQARVSVFEERLRDLAAGLAPLLLVQELLEEARGKAAQEESARRDAYVNSALDERDELLLQELARRGVPATTRRTVSEILQRDRDLRTSRATIPGLGIGAEAFAAVSPQSLSEVAGQLRESVEGYARAGDELARMEKLLVAVPDEEKIRVRVAELARVSAEEAALVSRLERLREEQSTVERERVTHEHELGRLLDDVAEQQAADEVTRRVIAHSGRCRETLHRFRQSMLERHVQRLERLVTEAMQSLLRKKTLVHHVSIDPETFALHVHGGSGAIVPAERLSAGERQLLAVAILWGLAQASGRQLPAIIDTPLGRLDSEHRTCLVRNYFPKASHQVILLSTDEEIDGPYYSEMKEWIGREYLITYDETSHSSRITPGYFPQARIAA